MLLRVLNFHLFITDKQRDQLITSFVYISNLKTNWSIHCWPYPNSSATNSLGNFYKTNQRETRTRYTNHHHNLHNYIRLSACSTSGSIHFWVASNGYSYQRCLKDNWKQSMSNIPKGITRNIAYGFTRVLSFKSIVSGCQCYQYICFIFECTCIIIWL